MEPSSCIKNVLFYFIGEPHQNPHTIGLIDTYAMDFHQKGIPQVVCSGSPHTLDLGKKIATDLNADLNLERTEQGPLGDSNLKKIIKEGKLSSEKLESVQEKIAQYRNTKVNDPYINNVTASQLLAKQAHLALGLHLLDKHIPFQGLGASEPEKFGFDFNIIMRERVVEHTKNIFEKALPKISRTGGVIWISLNAIEIPHLVVSVLKHIQTNSLAKEYSFAITPLLCSSPELKQAVGSIKSCISQGKHRNLFSNIDPSLYDEFSIQTITDIQEKSKGNFQSEKFSQYFDVGEKFYKKTNIFRIPSFTQDKMNMIKENHGKLLEINDTNAIVLISSDILLKPLRDKLGISRLKLNCANFEDRNIKEGMLSSYPKITVEPLPHPNQLLVTFPEEDRQVLTNLVNSKS
ncbi:MAG: hypothetical protein H0U49_08020 [Parachlamydiaceae bacterium]|nr:hypothetical protein [Parachlamydiaceae bacterium]